MSTWAIDARQMVIFHLGVLSCASLGNKPSGAGRTIILHLGGKGEE
jgi:hypothetical protein